MPCRVLLSRRHLHQVLVPRRHLWQHSPPLHARVLGALQRCGAGLWLPAWKPQPNAYTVPIWLLLSRGKPRCRTHMPHGHFQHGDWRHERRRLSALSAWCPFLHYYRLSHLDVLGWDRGHSRTPFFLDFTGHKYIGSAWVHFYV